MDSFLTLIAMTVLCFLPIDAYGIQAANQNTRVMRHERFASQIKKNATVHLRAGSVVQLDKEVRIPSGVTITTDKTNPATIVRSDSSTFALCIQGESVTIENVVMDFAMLGEWKDFRSMISFKMPGHLGIKPDLPIRDINIRNVTFIDSSPPETRSTKDSWAISLAHNNPESLRNIKVTGCKQLARRIQLTANGQGNGGIDGLEISHNYIEFGEANSIAVSSSTHNASFKNFLISHNQLRNCLNIGIFVGLDGGKGKKTINLQNVVISDNLIEMAPDSGPFPNCVYIRATGRCEDLLIARNIFDTTHASSLNSRWLTLQGSKVTPGSYQLIDNIRLGSGSLVVNSMKELSMKAKLPASNHNK